jgi:nucleoside-diphosphate-sugar epimerase
MVVAAAGAGHVETNESPGPFDFAFDIGHARSELGYQPISIEERIRQFVLEIRAQQAQAVR